MRLRSAGFIGRFQRSILDSYYHCVNTQGLYFNIQTIIWKKNIFQIVFYCESRQTFTPFCSCKHDGTNFQHTDRQKKHRLALGIVSRRIFECCFCNLGPTVCLPVSNIIWNHFNYFISLGCYLQKNVRNIWWDFFNKRNVFKKAFFESDLEVA